MTSDSERHLERVGASGELGARIEALRDLEASPEFGADSGYRDRLRALLPAAEAPLAAAIEGALRRARRADTRRREGRGENSEKAELAEQILLEGDAASRLAFVEATLESEAYETVPALTDHFGRESDPRIRSLVARTLGALGGKAVHPVLKEASRDPEPEVRIAAIQGLLYQRGSRRLRGLLERLADTEKDVRAAARDALAALPLDETLALVRELPPDKGVKMRRALVGVMKRFPDHPGARGWLREMLEFPQKIVSAEAFVALAEHRDPEAAEKISALDGRCEPRMQRVVEMAKQAFGGSGAPAEGAPEGEVTRPPSGVIIALPTSEPPVDPPPDSGAASGAPAPAGDVASALREASEAPPPRAPANLDSAPGLADADFTEAPPRAGSESETSRGLFPSTADLSSCPAPPASEAPPTTAQAGVDGPAAVASKETLVAPVSEGAAADAAGGTAAPGDEDEAELAGGENPWDELLQADAAAAVTAVGPPAPDPAPLAGGADATPTPRPDPAAGDASDAGDGAAVDAAVGLPGGPSPAQDAGEAQAVPPPAPLLETPRGPQPSGPSGLPARSNRGFRAFLLLLLLAALGGVGRLAYLAGAASKQVDQAARELRRDLNHLVRALENQELATGGAFREESLDALAPQLPPGALIDPWGNPYRYDPVLRCVRSSGPDGLPDGGLRVDASGVLPDDVVRFRQRPPPPIGVSLKAGAEYRLVAVDPALQEVSEVALGDLEAPPLRPRLTSSESRVAYKLADRAAGTFRLFSRRKQLGSRRVWEAPLELLPAGWDCREAEWAPNGEYLLVVAQAPGGPPALYVLIEGELPRPLAPALHHPAGISVHEGGRRVVLSASRAPDESPRLLLAGLEGDEVPTRLGPLRWGPAGRDPTFTGNPGEIAFVTSAADGPSKLMLWERDELGNPRRTTLYESRGPLRALTLSPGGEWLAFVEGEVVQLLRLGHRGVTPLLRAPTPPLALSWPVP